MNNEQAQAGFDSYAIVEIFGHQKYAGYVTTQAFGTAVMFRCDIPGLEERERVSDRAGYFDGKYYPAGTTIKEGSTQPYTKLFGVGAIYCITPCTQEACLKAVEEIQPRPLMLVSVPPEKALGPPSDTSDDDECPRCGKPEDLCRCS